ncbi:MAG TPA: MFS transporter [Steroidobacteraceae bacterium]|nr:MFS transporter [Steroidobacteraceae bacterium]
MTGPPVASPEERAVVRKVAVRLMPFLILLYFVAYLDRVNVSFAALTMNKDIGLTNTAFGIGSGIFFIGYFLFEVPSNLALQRFGARRWIARIMVSWGIVSMAMILARGPVSFHVLRFLLGVMEAGFFPGIVLYLTYWFPNGVRGSVMAYFFIAIPLANIVGGPVSTTLLDLPLFGLKGWQSMFVIEAVPALLLGFIVLKVLRDTPRDANWLTDGERATLTAAIDRDGRTSRHSSLRAGLLSLEVWGYTALYFSMVLGSYGFGFWAPKIIKSLGNLSNREVGWYIVIPFAASAVTMYFWGRHSDRTGERAWHVALPGFIGAAGFVYGSLTGQFWVSIVSLTVGAMGIYGLTAVFWTLPTAVLTGTAAAGGIALINSFGNLAGFLGPFLVGYFKDRTGSYTPGLITLASGLVIAGVLGLVLGKRQLRMRGEPRA